MMFGCLFDEIKIYILNVTFSPKVNCFTGILLQVTNFNRPVSLPYCMVG